MQTRSLSQSVCSLFAAALLCASAGANAQSAPDTAPVVVPPVQCEAPIVGKADTAAQDKRNQAKVETYKTCISDYAGAMRKQAEAHEHIAQQYTDAGNAAIEQFNKFIADLKERMRQ